MNTFKHRVLTLAALVAASLALAPSRADAQVDTRRRDRYERPLPPRDRRDWVVRPSVDRAERQSNGFRAWFENVYAHRHLGHDPEARDFKHEVQHLDEAMERLRSRADDHRPGIGRGELQDAIGHGRTVDRMILDDRRTRFAYDGWADLRATLNELARLYDVRGI